MLISMLELLEIMACQISFQICIVASALVCSVWRPDTVCKKTSFKSGNLLLLQSASGTISEVKYHRCNLRACTALCGTPECIASYPSKDWRTSSHYAKHPQQSCSSFTSFCRSVFRSSQNPYLKTISCTVTVPRGICFIAAQTGGRP